MSTVQQYSKVESIFRLGNSQGQRKENETQINKHTDFGVSRNSTHLYEHDHVSGPLTRAAIPHLIFLQNPAADLSSSTNIFGIPRMHVQPL